MAAITGLGLHGPQTVVANISAKAANTPILTGLGLHGSQRAYAPFVAKDPSSAPATVSRLALLGAGA